MSEEVVAEAELPLDSAGDKLVRGREAAGLTRKQVAAQTRIPERHLAAIESGDYGSLPARAYAVGFSRTYAKALGMDEAEVVAAVRAELAMAEPEQQRRPAQTFEPGDPARVPSARFAWLAALVALVVVLAGFALWRSYYAPGGSLPSILPEETPAPAAAAPANVPAAPPASGPVVFTAQSQGVWVKFYDGAGNQLLQKELALGESYTVPAELPDVKLWTALPDQLAITIGGQAVPKLSDVQRTMKDVPVTAAALLARGAAVPAPAAITAPAAAAPAAQRPRPRAAPRIERSAPEAASAPLAAPSEAVPAAAAPAPAPAAT